MESQPHEEWSPIARVYHPLKAGSIDATDTEPHDRGIVRALQASYRPNKLVVGDPRLTIFVARLNPKTTEATLKNFFSRFGSIRRCRLVRDIVTGFSKCYAFVEYKDRESALQAHRDAFKSILDDNEIFVDFECERTLPGWVPRRLGGGFGGKKESGQLRFGGRLRPFKKPIILNKDRYQDSRDREFRRGSAHSRYSDDRPRYQDSRDRPRYHERDDKHSYRRDRNEKHKSRDRR